MGNISEHPYCLYLSVIKNPATKNIQPSKHSFIVYKYITFSDDTVVSCLWFVLSHNPLVTEGITETLYFTTEAWPHIEVVS